MPLRTPPAPPPTATNRRGACPGVHDPFAEADGLLIRIRVPGGILTTRQAAVVADVAHRYGSGTIEITSRANIQVRGVSHATHDDLVRRLVSSGLAHPDPGVDQRRNVVSSPTSGLDPGDGRGLLDPRPVVAELVDRLTSSRACLDLDPKAGVVVDDGGRFSVTDRRHTVALAAVRLRTGEVVYRISDSNSRASSDVVAPQHAAVVAFDLLNGRAPHRESVETVDPATIQPGRPFAGPPIGSFTSFVGAAPVLGRLDARTLSAVAELAVDEVRLTPWRGLVLPGLSSGTLTSLADLGMITDPTDPATGVIACAGNAGCTQGRADTVTTALDVVERLRRERIRMTVHVSGCEKRCASRAPHDVTLVANDDGDFDCWDDGR